MIKKIKQSWNKSKFKEDLVTGKWFAITEWFFNLHSGKKTYFSCTGAIGLNYYLYTLKIPAELWIFVLSTEYFIVEIAKKHSQQTEIK